MNMFFFFFYSISFAALHFVTSWCCSSFFLASLLDDTDCLIAALTNDYI